MKSLSYSNVKYTPRVSLILLAIGKLKSENFNLVPLSFPLSFLLSFFPSFLPSFLLCFLPSFFLFLFPTFLLSFFFLSYFLSFFFTHNTKMCGINELSTKQTSDVLSEIFLFVVRAACELRSARDGSKHALLSLFVRHQILRVVTRTTRKLRAYKDVVPIKRLL